MKIRVVTFDAAGTLIRLVQPPGFVYADVAQEFGYSLNRDNVQNAFRSVWKTFPLSVESDGPIPDDDRNWWRALVAATIAEAGYSIEPFDRYFATVYERFALPGVWEVFPDIPRVVAELQRFPVRLGVISNFDQRLYRILEDLKLRSAFEHVVISSEIGARKPAGRIFEVAAHQFNVSLNELLHIGDDSEADFDGARSAGCNALLVDRTRQNLSQIPFLL
ncbi:MAG TPA: HAD-IA family hydrolase [Chthoniobacterales bacterium]|nr:HAD-IA family hydrolase [Chthoniobacterales bacterium]